MILAPRNISVYRINSSDILINAEVVVGVGLHNQAKAINRCLSSIFAQKMEGRKIAVVLLDDKSSDDWEKQAGNFLNRPEIVVLKGNCGTPSRTRNAILDFVDKNFLKAKWVARLDADDKFTCSKSLSSICAKGESANAKYVIGGNRLVLNGQVLKKENPAKQDLLCGNLAISILKEMADGTARNELPSCNLLLATGSGWRYPDIKSAEDHWLVADLLLNQRQFGAILKAPYYCDYTLYGAETKQNTINLSHYSVRKKLYEAVLTWQAVKSLGGNILGHGQEGIVRQIGGYIEKYFYSGSYSKRDTAAMMQIKTEQASFIPSPEWFFNEGKLVGRYPYVQTKPADNITLDQAREFLLFCLKNEVVCKNIKFENFRVRPDGKLFMADIGKDIVPMKTYYFRDSAARLYAIAGLGYSDGEFLRRKDKRRQHEVLVEITGFKDFYRELILSHANYQWKKAPCSDPIELPIAEDVTLLIKCCAMDSEFLDHQVRYITRLLSKPRKFKEIILIIDSYSGPFLRQHCSGNLELLINKANKLKENCIIDRLLIAPSDDKTVQAINTRWFNLNTYATRTTQKAPVTSQLWGFEQVKSRYVLQCDVDVLIGRYDLEHDFLGEMLKACSSQKDVLGVAFNIPHTLGTINPYSARSGEYVPEVRCGLLDLHRIQKCLPLPNSEKAGLLDLTWHRSLQLFQKKNALRTLRGGDARTFYIHPENHWKQKPEFLAVIRDLIAQGNLPHCQIKEWDLMGGEKDWNYPSRNEDIIFLLKGRNTPKEKLKRCIASLKMQDDQDFGLIVIDDASEKTDVSLLQHYLKPFEKRFTLIRRSENRGRIPNFITGIRDICIKPETLVVILDLDDALINSKTVSMLREKWIAGHDIILGGMFRPDKPLKLYNPSFENIRENWGAEVWTHLRSFQKKLFDLIPDEALKINDKWIKECTDYATMIPMVEMSSYPSFIPEYLYWHERTTIRTPEVCSRQEQLIKQLIDNKSLCNSRSQYDRHKKI